MATEGSFYQQDSDPNKINDDLPLELDVESALDELIALGRAVKRNIDTLIKSQSNHTATRRGSVFNFINEGLLHPDGNSDNNSPRHDGNAKFSEARALSIELGNFIQDTESCIQYLVETYSRNASNIIEIVKRSLLNIEQIFTEIGQKPATRMVKPKWTEQINGLHATFLVVYRRMFDPIAPYFANSNDSNTGEQTTNSERNELRLYDTPATFIHYQNNQERTDDTQNRNRENRSEQQVEEVDESQNYRRRLGQANNYFYGINSCRNYSISFTLYSDLAQRNVNEAMYMLSKCYRKGFGTMQDSNMADLWYQKALESGNLQAKFEFASDTVKKASKNDLQYLFQDISTDSVFGQRSSHKHHKITETQKAMKIAQDWINEAYSDENLVGDCEELLGYVAEKLENYPEALQKYEIASQSGSAQATFALGRMYMEGLGILPQPEIAFRFFLLAARSGISAAYHSAGVCFEKGLGCDKSMLDSMECYHRAAVDNHVESMYSLGYLMVKRAMRIAEMKDEEGEERYISVSEGLYQNLVRREIIFDDLPKIERRKTQRNLFLEAIVRNGVNWLKRAGEHGIMEAQFQLGQLYEQGSSLIPVDLFSAFSHYHMAAERGHTKACLYTANMAYRGAGSDVDYPLAAFFYLQSAKSGNTEAMNSLGIMLEDGITTKTSLWSLEDLHNKMMADKVREAAATAQQHMQLQQSTSSAPSSPHRKGFASICDSSDTSDVDRVHSLQEAAMWYFEAALLKHTNAASNLTVLLARNSFLKGFYRWESEAFVSYFEATQWLLQNVKDCREIFERVSTELMCQVNVNNSFSDLKITTSLSESALPEASSRYNSPPRSRSPIDGDKHMNRKGVQWIMTNDNEMPTASNAESSLSYVLRPSAISSPTTDTRQGARARPDLSGLNFDPSGNLRSSFESGISIALPNIK